MKRSYEHNSDALSHCVATAVLCFSFSDLLAPLQHLCAPLAGMPPTENHGLWQLSRCSASFQWLNFPAHSDYLMNL